MPPITSIPTRPTFLLAHELGASDPNPVARASRLAGYSALYAPAVCAHAELVSHRGLQAAPRATACECCALPRPRVDTEPLHRRLAEQASKCTVHLLVASPTGTESSGSTSRNSARVLCPERTVPWRRHLPGAHGVRRRHRVKHISFLPEATLQQPRCSINHGSLRRRAHRQGRRP